MRKKYHRMFNSLRLHYLILNNQPSAATSSGSSMKEQSGKVEDTVSTSGNKDSAAADPSTEIK